MEARAKLFSGQQIGLGGSQVYLYRPNLPEGYIDIPDQCIVVFFLTGACREKFWGKLIRYSSPTRCRERFWGNIICINQSTIDTEIKAKRNNMIYELITFRITKAQRKRNLG